MWILETTIGEHKFWVQVTNGGKLRMNGLRDNAAVYPLYSQAADAMRAYKGNFSTPLSVVPRDAEVVETVQ